jgi:hypothetical protein
VALLLTSCGGDGETENDTTPGLHAVEIIPDHGPKNTVVKIIGTGFSLVPQDNTVTLNGKPCVVTDALKEMLTISIPPGAGSGKIKIDVGDQEIFTSVFKYEYTGMNVITVAGGEKGYMDGSGTSAQFRTPVTVIVDTFNNIYVADQGNHKIRKITSAGVVTTLAGSDKGYQDGAALSAKFNLPTGLVLDKDQNLIITDAFNDKIRKLTPQGIVSTIAGSSTGYADGNRDAAKFDVPYGIAMDSDGNFIVADYLNNRIRKVTAAGDVTTLAGQGSPGFSNGTGASAYFYYPTGVAVGDDNTIYIADQFNHRIRSITGADVGTLAGSGPVGEFNNGFADGDAGTSRCAYPTGVTFSHRDSTIVFADTRNHRIRIIKEGEVSTLTGDYGYADGAGPVARFFEPTSVAIDRDGNIIVADSQNHRIRKIVFE